nr:colicin immunity domain-containing protein [Neisseria lisongii]
MKWKLRPQPVGDSPILNLARQLVAGEVSANEFEDTFQRLWFREKAFTKVDISPECDYIGEMETDIFSCAESYSRYKSADFVPDQWDGCGANELNARVKAMVAYEYEDVMEICQHYHYNIGAFWWDMEK